MGWRRTFVAALVTFAGCTSAAEAPGTSGPGPGGKGDYYGQDDRQQIMDVSDPRVREWAKAVAIVVNRNRLSSAASGVVSATASSLGERSNLCSDERFYDEPAFGFCSSYLVAPDLVATAGHCLNETLCSDMAFVFDFYIGGASENLAAIPARNVYTCNEVVARQNDGVLDYALVRLDRPTSARMPFKLQATPPAVGSGVALIGFPSGIYAKVDLAGRVVRREGNRIRTSVDSFPGHSGGVMIDLASGNAFGVHVEGSLPAFVSTSTCQRAARCDTVTPDGGKCQGAVETSVDVFASCCGGGSTTPPPPPSCNDRCGATEGGCACDLACASRGDCCADYAAICEPGSTGRTCVGDGGPCAGDTNCSDVMCSCNSEHAFSETFIVPGRCTADGCADLQQLCADACENMEPVVADEPFTLGWWAMSCEAR